MRLPTLLLAMLIIIPAAKIAQAEQQKDWIPRGIATLQQSASSKTEFTFDHSMLVFASKLDSENADLRRVIAGVSGLSVRNYHFQEAWQYDRAALNSVNEEYRTAGWTRLVSKGATSEGPGTTSLWVRLENNAISNVAILVARSNEVSFVVVSGSISPLDISHLGGHFGIPKIEGGVLVPNIALPHP
jgi:Domain of unknown function (DUF4252)